MASQVQAAALRQVAPPLAARVEAVALPAPVELVKDSVEPLVDLGPLEPALRAGAPVVARLVARMARYVVVACIFPEEAELADCGAASVVAAAAGVVALALHNQCQAAQLEG